MPGRSLVSFLSKQLAEDQAMSSDLEKAPLPLCILDQKFGVFPTKSRIRGPFWTVLITRMVMGSILGPHAGPEIWGGFQTLGALFGRSFWGGLPVFENSHLRK